MKKIFLLAVFMLHLFQVNAQNTFTEKDREIMRLQFENMNQRFESINQRFESINQRFEAVNQRLIDMEKRSDDRFSEMQKQMDVRFEQVDKRLDTLTQFIVGILATFTALCGIMFGLMIWDRRTTLRPFEEKIKTIDKQVEELAENKTTLKKMLTALQQQAQKDTQLAEILKSVNLL
jgi:DNA anti-recombination protein RmuC